MVTDTEMLTSEINDSTIIIFFGPLVTPSTPGHGIPSRHPLDFIRFIQAILLYMMVNDLLSINPPDSLFCAYEC